MEEESKMPEVIQPPPKPEVTQLPSKKKQLLAFLVLAAIVFCILFLTRIKREQNPPSPDVAATFSSQTLTAEQLKAYAKTEGAREESHYICKEHGFNHERCSKEEECEMHPIDSLEGYRQLAQMYALEKIILEWAEKQEYTNREEVQHSLGDMFQEASVDETIHSLYENNINKDAVSSWDIQKYYEDNLQKYQGKEFSEVKEEISNELLSQKSKEFFPQYVEELKKRAGIQINNGLLADESLYDLNKDMELFQIHGKKYSLGQFNREFSELPEEIQKEYATYAKKKLILEQFAIRELLLESSGDKTDENDRSHRMEELKIQYLNQLMHKEKVDDTMNEFTDEDAKKYFDENQKSFVSPKEVKFSIIWVAKIQIPDDKRTDTSADNTKQRQKIGEAYKRLKEGAGFAEIARQYSEDTNAANGGKIDTWIPEGTHMTKEISEKLFQLSVGKLSKIIETGNGFAIVKVDEIQERQALDFEKVKDGIKSHLQDIEHEKKEKEMSDEILKDANLIIYNKTLRKMTEESGGKTSDSKSS